MPVDVVQGASNVRFPVLNRAQTLDVGRVLAARGVWHAGRVKYMAFIRAAVPK